jgi:hypothetical protein
MTSVDSEEIEDNGSSEEEEATTLQKVVPVVPRTHAEKQNMPRVYVILEQANLQTVKTKKGVELLNCDEH